MLYNAKNLIDSKIQAINGDLGRLDDFYFDDRSWGIRYMVVDTAKWIEGRKVLLSPVVVINPDMTNKILSVNLTKEQIQSSPDIDTRRPVTSGNEPEYSWPTYGMGVLETPLMMDQDAVTNNYKNSNSFRDPNLKSAIDVFGYHISALDGEIGLIDDMIIDDETWNIHFWVVKTKSWLPGKKVLISPHWINLISWVDEKVFVDMTVDSVKNSPEYDPTKPIEVEYETELNNYYGRTRMRE